MEKILIDIDGVVADFWSGFSAILKVLNPAVERTMGLTRKSYQYTEEEQKAVLEAWKIVRESSVFWRNLPPICNAETFHRLDKLRKWNELYFVTARIGLHPQHDTMAWLIRQGMGCPTVIVPESKMTSDAVPYANKAAVAKAIGIEWALEDSPHVAGKLMAKVPNTYLITRPYNKDIEGIARVKTVIEFIDIVEQAC